MKQRLTLASAALLAAMAVGCTKKNTGMENNNTPKPQTETQTIPDSTNNVPGTGAAAVTNCPDPSMPGYDPTKADPACPRAGADIPPPATPTDPSRPTPP